jgi:glycosyltransferase involved in cell wall biosynthesis
MPASLSIVIPVYDEPEFIGPTVRAAVEAIAASPFEDAEIVVVDDGSPTPAQDALAGIDGGVPVRVIRQENQGRFRARQNGLEAARGELALLLDSRVTLDRDALRFAADQVEQGRRVWNGHCMIDPSSGPYAKFWDVLTRAAFPDYLGNPRHVSFGVEEYDRFPKGTGHFLAPRRFLLDAIAEFASHYDDLRFVSDDTHLLRAVAAREPINLAPGFASTYHSRTSLQPFLKHAMYRGTTFVDSFGRPGTRFFPIVVAAPFLSVAGILTALRFPRLGALGAAALAAAGTAFGLRAGRPPREAAQFGALIPPFAVAWAAGVWRGIGLAIKGARS